MDNVGYQQMTHMGNEGMSLSIRNTQEKFELFVRGIDFLEPADKSHLIDLVKDFVPQYQKLNPYALALGFLAISKEGGITKEGLIISDEMRRKSFSFFGVPLDELIAVSDILRYARLYENVYKQSAVFQPISNQEDLDDEFDTGFNYDDEEDNENDNNDGYGFESEGEDEYN
jgi:hypothetical protein